MKIKVFKINTDLEDELEDKFYIIAILLNFKSKGLICTTSGPASIGQILKICLWHKQLWSNVNSILIKGHIF